MKNYTDESGVPVHSDVCVEGTPKVVLLMPDGTPMCRPIGFGMPSPDKPGRWVYVLVTVDRRARNSGDIHIRHTIVEAENDYDALDKGSIVFDDEWGSDDTETVINDYVVAI